MNNSNSDTSSSSYFDSSFDYRSLLPIHSSSAAAEEPKESCCSFLPELSWRERCIGCATCMIAGYLLSMGSFWRIKDLMTGNPMPFVVNATVGNMIALAGSFFFTGPTQQIKKMCHEKRRIATGMYIGSLALTLIVAFSPVPGKGFLLLILMVAQYIAVAWYCLSYIPFAHEAVCGYLQRFWQQSTGSGTEY